LSDHRIDRASAVVSIFVSLRGNVRFDFEGLAAGKPVLLEREGTVAPRDKASKYALGVTLVMCAAA
jgi:hypothetical protein